MLNPEIKPALDAIGFVPDSTTTAINTPSVLGDFDLKFYPNPSKDKGFIDLNIENTTVLSLNLYDLNGRLIKNYFNKKEIIAGKQTLELDFKDVIEGIYLLILRGGDFEVKRKISVVRF